MSALARGAARWGARAVRLTVYHDNDAAMAFYRKSGFALNDRDRTAALTGIAAASDLYRVGPIYLRTAFAPVLDMSGEVRAVVGVDGGTARPKVRCLMTG